MRSLSILAPALIAAGLALPAEQAMPLYIRDKVAKTTLEREAEKRLAASITPLTAPASASAPTTHSP